MSSRDSAREAIRPNSGFTLIELMVVVVLIGIMTAMIIPEMTGTYQDALLRSNSRKLISVFDLAYSQAVSAGLPHRVRLDLKKGRYVIEKTATDAEDAGGFVPLRNMTGSEGELDTRITIEIHKQDEELPAPSNEEPPLDEAPPEPESDIPDDLRRDIITFYPDGTADAGEILLKDREGFRLVLRINPTTARVRIVELERE